ncbi:hypothetical protein [Pedobacter mendelii]|uniref:MJ0042 family finger-like protein n=1 Tax=Pedobacter mendelii TaxID=1908240 RepID=A0ABQ2BHH2_9SPHI|nr:hypothetical protein [Pedobacter mendelii]GGI24278.1 hypothetical protein GCM10008119_11860 [Pedobacter mendelii]
MMNQQDIFRKIGSILNELNEQYQFLAQNPEKLNELELELFLANADFLSDHVKIVKKLNILITEEHPVETNAGLLLEEQNTIVLPEITQSYKQEEETHESIELEEIATAEEEEERIDMKPEEEINEEEVIHEEAAEKILEHNFFKPDQDSNSFEFVLGNHGGDDRFDYEEKSANEIFDRPLSREEEEIIAQKKRIHEKEQEPEKAEPVAADEDEIGPEPFLISHEEDAVNHHELETLFSQTESKPVESIQPDFDEDIISPPVEERPAFIPEAVPVKPILEPISDKPAPSLNDLLAKTNSSQNEPIKAPISDLKQSINLNEKLLFIKDLFSGYNMAYSEALDIVNKMPNFESADSFLQNNYAVKNNWATKQTTVDQFYELLNRRFS